MEIVSNSKNNDRIKSIDKAIDILEFLSNDEQEIGISEISKRLHMGLSTVHRILFTLKSRGFIVQNQKTTKYRLGIKLFELGCEVHNSRNLIKIVKPYLRELSTKTNETANLAILEGNQVVYLDTIESSETLRTGIVPGSRKIAHCTALGKVLLSHLSNNDLEKLYKNYQNNELGALTNKSITSLALLKKELKKVKENCCAYDIEEFMIGINCIAVPVMSRIEEAIAAISITGPSSRFVLKKMESAKTHLITTSQEISKLL